MKFEFQKSGDFHFQVCRYLAIRGLSKDWHPVNTFHVDSVLSAVVQWLSLVVSRGNTKTQPRFRFEHPSFSKEFLELGLSYTSHVRSENLEENISYSDLSINKQSNEMNPKSSKLEQVAGGIEKSWLHKLISRHHINFN